MTAPSPEHDPSAPNGTPPPDVLPDPRVQGPRVQGPRVQGPPVPDPPVPPRPNIHVTALIVWLTIFPLVAIFGTLLAPMTMDWHPVLRAFVITLIVVPIAAYWLMPQMFRWYAAFERRRAARRAGRSAS